MVFLLPLMVPLQPSSNIQLLSAVLVSHVPVSFWLNDVAPWTVGEVEGTGWLGENEARRRWVKLHMRSMVVACRTSHASKF